MLMKLTPVCLNITFSMSAFSLMLRKGGLVLRQKYQIKIDSIVENKFNYCLKHSLDYELFHKILSYVTNRNTNCVTKRQFRDNY